MLYMIYSIFQASGVIIEPPLPEVAQSETYVIHPMVIVVGLVLVLLSLLVINWIGELWLIVIPLVGLLVVGGLAFYSYSQSNDGGADRKDYRAEHAERVAVLLSDHYGFTITGTQVTESRLIEAVEAQVVEEIVFNKETLRDPEKDEWVVQTSSFLVDGKVVEVHVSQQPLEESLTPNAE